jgi:hypothetical protein
MTSSDPALADIAAACLDIRSDRSLWESCLAPFSDLIGPGVTAPDTSTTLAGFRAIGELRNRILGHGTVGWRIAIEPHRYLAAAHRALLIVLGPVAALDWTMTAYRGPLGERFEQDRTFGHSMGILPAEGAEDDSLVLGGLKDSIATLNPFVRFRSQRLLILNRIRGGEAHYFDFGAERAIEPAHVVIAEPPARFLDRLPGSL